MRVIIHVFSALSHQIEWGKAFAEGLARHGIEAKQVMGFDPVDCDLAVFWSWNKRKDAIELRQRSRGLHCLVMERGYFADRFKWTSLGYDGLNGRADFCNANSPSDRWELHKHLMKPWNPGKDYVLLIGQHPSDSSCNMVNIQQWYVESVMKARAIQELPVVFRHHPSYQNPSIPCDIRVVGGSLENCLKKAACVITFSSTVGVIALLAGIPVVAADPISMVYQMTANNVPGGFLPSAQLEPDRQQWAYDLAYTQWTEKEIRTGAAWVHLRRKYE